jgi:phage shock protein A
MKVFKRIYISLFGAIDSVVDRLQNHDALVAASLAELDAKLREARSSYASLTRTLQKTDEDIARANKEHELWRSRARERLEQGSKDAALECLRRSQSAEQTSKTLQVQRQSSESARQRVEQTINEMQNMHKMLTLRHRELKAREQCQGLSISTPVHNVKDVEEMLHRWEDSLGGGIEESPPLDEFSAEFEKRERDMLLEQELEQLMKETNAA